jgi:hypothetical protein
MESKNGGGGGGYKGAEGRSGQGKSEGQFSSKLL